MELINVNALRDDLNKVDIIELDRKVFNLLIDRQTIIKDIPTDERLEKIADHYGLNSQLDILQEECAELVQAVSKYRRGGSNLLVLEELADVEIMVAQIRYLAGKNSIIIDDFKEKKIRRQLDRMEGEDNG